MAESLFFYKVNSNYYDEHGKPIDITKNCKLSIGEIDSNFLTLKDYDISAATFVRGEDCTKSDGTLIITRNNGQEIKVDIDTTIDKNFTYDFNTVTECGDKNGVTLTITYKDDDGEKSTTIENIITADNLIDVIGNDVLTKVISDNTLRGLGTMKSPLGIAGVEKTGMLAPAIKVIDLTDGGTLPTDAENGTRYVTKEKVNDYGYLYNGNGVKKIQELLDLEYDVNEICKEVSDRKYYWRVPSKADWDKLLNSIEPCEYRNHNSAQCHVELGKVAGKYLKSECGWVGQEQCTCSGTKPYIGTCSSTASNASDDSDDYIFDNTDVTPNENPINEDAKGVDKYGMKVLPAGSGYYKNGQKYQGITEQAFFWTTTEIAEGQDTYVKVFDYDKGGVWQVAECPTPYYSVRLVKDYDGSNYRDSEYIDGVLYKAILMPESGQVWLATNFADKKGFETEGKDAEVLLVNGGHILESRVEMFINEYNGRYWEKKVMNEGDTIVIQNPCFDPDAKQKNLEYRVYVENCDKYLKNTDDLITERILDIVIPLIDEERDARISGDTILQYEIDELSAYTISAITDLEDALEEERQIRESADTEIWDAIDAISSTTTELLDMLSAETEARIEGDEILSGAIEDERAEREAVDEALSGAIDTEREERISADTALDEKIDAETERAKEREDEISGLTIDTSSAYTMSASVEKNDFNLVLESKDKNPDHFIKVKFDGNFGEI